MSLSALIWIHVIGILAVFIFGYIVGSGRREKEEKDLWSRRES